GASDGYTLQRRALFGQVDETPVGEASNDQSSDSFDRRLVVERRGKVRNLAEEVESSLPLGRIGHRRSFGTDEAVALLLDPLELADIDEEALAEERPAVAFRDRPRVLAGPDHRTVPGQDPVLSLERRT